MILLMRNDVNEFVPGCDYTVVRLNAPLVESIARRAAACGAMKDGDSSLGEVRYWDASPECVGSLDPEKVEAIEDAVESGDGWAVMADDALGAFEATHADCTQMVVYVADPLSIGWAYRIGSEAVLTADVDLKELAAKLGSPLGDALAVP